MNRRTFLLSVAAVSLAPTIALARPRRRIICRYNQLYNGQGGVKNLPVIRMEKGVIINQDFLFENISYHATLGVDGNFYREVRAWLNEADSVTWDGSYYWGEVLVRQCGGWGCWGTITIIYKVPESKTKERK
jgi:hypothetical protein